MIPMPTPCEFVQYVERGTQWPFLVIAIDRETGTIDGYAFTDHSLHLYKGVAFSDLEAREGHWQAVRFADGPFG